MRKVLISFIITMSILLNSLLSSPYLLNMQTAEIPDSFGGSVSLMKSELHYKKIVMIDTTLLANFVLLINGGVKVGYTYSDFSFSVGVRYFKFLGEDMIKNFLQNKMNEVAEASNTTAPTINDLNLNIYGVKIIPSVSYSVSDNFKVHTSLVFFKMAEENMKNILYVGSEWRFYSYFSLMGEFYTVLNSVQTKMAEDYVLYNLAKDNFGFGLGVRFRKKKWSVALGFTYPGFHIKIDDETEFKMTVLPYINAAFYF